MKTFVGVPCGSGTMQGGLAAFLVALASRPDMSIGIYNGLKGIAFARNTIATACLSTDCDRLWFLDSDVIPSFNAIQLLASDGDIVAGTYSQIMATGNGAYSRLNHVVGGEDGKVIDIPDEALIDVGYVGFGNVIIKREVLEALTFDDTTDPLSIFREHRLENGQMTVTDDAEFCRRAREAGFSVRLECGIRFGHVKSIDLRLIENHSTKWLETAVA